MKFLVIFACVIVLASSAEIRQHLKNAISYADREEIIETCMSDNNITRSDWIPESSIMTGAYAEPENAEKRRNSGCAMACILKKLNLTDESNNIKESKVHEEITKEVGLNSPYLRTAHKIAHKCIKEVNSIVDECDKGFSLYACVCRALHKVAEHEEHEREVENNSEHTQEEVTGTDSVA